MKKPILVIASIFWTLVVNAQSLSYSSNSGGLSETVLSNNGTIEGDIMITIEGATFSNPAGILSTNDFMITNLPSGIIESLSISPDGTAASLILDGQASFHQTSNNVNDLIFTFENSAFVGINANEIANAINGLSSVALAFVNNPSLSYSGDDFLEVPENNGSVSGSMTITNTGGTFIHPNGTLTSPEHYEISNLPEGFITEANVSSNGEIVQITILGEAKENQEVDNIGGLIFTFNDAAFSGDILATTVFNSVNRNSEIGIDFNDNPILSYSSTPSILSPENIKDAALTGKGLAIGRSSSLYISNDGGSLFVGENFTITRYELSTPFDIGTAQMVNQLSSDRTIIDFDFSMDESILFVHSTIILNGTNTNDRISRFDLTSALDISGVDLNNLPGDDENSLNPGDTQYFSQLSRGEFRPGSGGFDFTCFSLNNDGSKLYVGFNRGGIMQFSLNQNYNLSEPQFKVFGFALNAEFIEFSEDGMLLYLGSAEDSIIYQFTLDEAFNITSAKHNRVDQLKVDDKPDAMAFFSGDEKFLLSMEGSSIEEYNFLADGFIETEINDGAVNGSLDINILNAAFSNPGTQLSHNLDYFIPNLPEGLIPSLVVASDGRSATLTLSGNAVSNERANDVSGLIFSFQNSAFNTLVDVNDFINVDSVDSQIPVRFILDNDLIPQNVISTPNPEGESESTFPITVAFTEPVFDFSAEDILIDPIQNTGSFDGVIENFIANADSTEFTFDFRTLSFLNSNASVIYGLRLFNFSTFNASGNGNVASDTLIIKTGIFTNNPPEVEDQTFEIEEFTFSGTLVGSVVASDLEGDDLTFTISDTISYTGKPAFVFVDNEIRVNEPGELDLDIRERFHLLVEVQDVINSVTATITILLLPEQEQILNVNGNNEKLELYPNPVSDLVKISLPKDHLATTYNLIDINGKEYIKTKNINTSTFDVNMRSLPPGIFILQIMYKDGNIIKHKIVRE